MAVVGIDLGTTNSVVGSVDDSGAVVIIPDRQGRRLHPSVVSFQPDGTKLFSHEAFAQRISNPQYTVYSAKRLIGQAFRSDEVKLATSRFPYTVEEGNNEQAVFVGPDRAYTIPEISGLILSYLRQCAETFLGAEVTGAVITVPANFNDAQRRATIDAGRIAGLDVMRVLNEPTAAALAYGAGQNMSRRLAVYDLGGGTFDVTVLQVEGEIFEVLATGGDTFLGGDDVDTMLMNMLSERFMEQHNIDPRLNAAARSRLVLAAEQVKRHLSDHPEAKGDLKNIGMNPSGEPLNLRFHITRAEFEKTISNLIVRTLTTCDEVLGAAALLPSQIDEVILVGGSTRIPLVRSLVQRHFGRPPRTDLNPDEVVCHGAAIQANNLTHGGSGASETAVLLDVTPRALGIAVAGGFSEPIVDRNVQVPVEQTRVFSTSADNQTSVRIQVCQGESRRFSENTPIGELELGDLPVARRGEVKIEVTFRIDTNGILRVRVRDPASGLGKEAAVNIRGQMTESEVDKAAAEVESKTATGASGGG
jgi:molecular chaperone DnaK